MVSFKKPEVQNDKPITISTTLPQPHSTPNYIPTNYNHSKNLLTPQSVPTPEFVGKIRMANHRPTQVFSTIFFSSVPTPIVALLPSVAPLGSLASRKMARRSSAEPSTTTQTRRECRVLGAKLEDKRFS